MGTDVSTTTTENITTTEDTVINSLYSLMEKNIREACKSEIKYGTTQSNSGVIIANGPGTKIDNVTET